MRVVAFTGMPGAGKSEAVEEARRRGLAVITMGDFVRDATKARSLPLTDENVGKVASAMRREQGEDHWAQVTADRILVQWKDHPLVIIDGVRTIAEVETFRKRLGDAFHLVAIEAPFEVRAERLFGRGRSDDATTRDKVRQRDERELGWGIEKAIASADQRIVNTPPLEDFRRQIATVFDDLMREGRGSARPVRGAASGRLP